jgi:hypothetical protein
MTIMKFRSFILAASLLVSLPLASSHAEVEFSVGWAPPPLPVYEQPACPVEGYIWTPGYWGWNNYYYDYYWVPGVWVPPPRIGLLWTPGWWGWRGGAYAFNQGYWGPTVGFYGGINYGYGYTGNGYWGGRWNGNTFQYNTAVTRVNKTVVHNTYVNNSVSKNVNANRTSFNGGNNGIKAEPNAEQKAAMASANKVGPTSQQLNRQQAASKDQNLRASVNKGKPNQEAIRSFNKTEVGGQGKGPQEVGAAGGAAGAGPGKAGNEPGNMAQRKEGAAGAGAGAGKAENSRTDMGERNRQGVGAGNGGAGKVAGNENKSEHQRNRGNMDGNQTKMHGAQSTANNRTTLGPRGRDTSHSMNQTQRNQQMRNAQMRHPQMQGGGNRQPKGQQPQGKKKPNQR